jgi:hypothetical protein
VGTIHARTTAFDFTVDTRPGETILEALRRNQLPAPGFLLYDNDQRFVSLARVLSAEQSIDAYSLRNPDFAILDPPTCRPTRPKRHRCGGGPGPGTCTTSTKRCPQLGGPRLARCWPAAVATTRGWSPSR